MNAPIPRLTLLLTNIRELCPDMASEFNRTIAMSKAWDEAAEHLSHGNVTGFDAAMRKFKQHQEGGLA